MTREGSIPPPYPYLLVISFYRRSISGAEDLLTYAYIFSVGSRCTRHSHISQASCLFCLLLQLGPLPQDCLFFSITVRCSINCRPLIHLHKQAWLAHGIGASQLSQSADAPVSTLALCIERSKTQLALSHRVFPFYGPLCLRDRHKHTYGSSSIMTT